MLNQLGDVRDLRRQMLMGAVLARRPQATAWGPGPDGDPPGGWRLIRSEMTEIIDRMDRMALVSWELFDAQEQSADLTMVGC